MIPEPTYGSQLQNFSVQGLLAEGRMEVTYVEETQTLADGEMAMCAYTWAMIIERLGRQVAAGERQPYFTASVPLPR